MKKPKYIIGIVIVGLIVVLSSVCIYSHLHGSDRKAVIYSHLYGSNGELLSCRRLKLSKSDIAFLGNSDALFLFKEEQNGYRVSIFHNKQQQLDIIHFERGDSISRYCAIPQLPSALRGHYDSIGVYNVDIEIPVCLFDTLGSDAFEKYLYGDGKESPEIPEMFFMDVNFDGEEEFVIKLKEHKVFSYDCFDLVKGNRKSVRPGILKPISEPPYDNIVSGSAEPAYTVFDHKKKEIYIMLTSGCCSYYETWAKFFEGDMYGNEDKVKVIKKVDHKFSDKIYTTTYELQNGTLKMVSEKVEEF